MAKCLELEGRIQTAECVFKQDMSSANLTVLTRLKYEFNSLLTQKAEFALFRARHKYFEEGDKAGRLLARYIRQRENESIILGVADGNGIVRSDSTLINGIFRDFYSNLYKSELHADPQEISSFLASLDLPSLSDEQCAGLDRPITLEEIKETIMTLKSGRAPGLDGFTAEFYKTYVEEISPILLDMYREAIETGILPPTLNEALITVILKKGKAADDCKNYRPISLLGQDRKIFSKILANRLDKIITSIIHPDQVGFIRSRNSSDNIRRLLNIMWYCQNENSPAAAISLDAEKAFDRVEWRYLFLALEQFGFSETFIKRIQLLYANPKASVLTNGVISQKFDLCRGTAQGDPLSPLLFALALEPLAAAVRKAPDFPGIQIGESAHKIMLYADDILIFVSQPLRSLPALFGIIESFSKLSGYKVNWGKSEALPLTSYCPKTLFQANRFQWPVGGITYLGMLFPPLINDIVEVNMVPLLGKFKNDIERWNSLYISLWGKANILKMNCVPKFNYLLQALPINIPLKYFKQFDKLCNQFLWNNKRPRLGLKRLQWPIDQGGMGIPNILLYHYAFSLRHLAHWSLPPERAPPWFQIEKHFCDALPLIYFTTAQLPEAVSDHPIFLHLRWVWKRMSLLFKFNLYHNPSSCIWLNPKLLIDKRTFIWNLWVEKGILSLKDLYDGNTLKSFTQLCGQYNLPRNHFWKYLQLRHLLLTAPR